MTLATLAALGAALIARAHASPPSRPLTPERVFSSPALSGPAARGAKISPDGRWVTFLRPEPANQNKLDLWIVPVSGGSPRLLVSGEAVEPSGGALTEEEKARRERQRIASVSGVTGYQWQEDGRRLLIPAGGGLYLADAGTGAVTKLPVTGASDARLSPSGRYVAFVRDQNLHLSRRGGGRRAAPDDGGRRTPSASGWPSSSPRKRWAATPATGCRRTRPPSLSRASMSYPSRWPTAWRSGRPARSSRPRGIRARGPRTHGSACSSGASPPGRLRSMSISAEIRTSIWPGCTGRRTAATSTSSARAATRKPSISCGSIRRPEHRR